MIEFVKLKNLLLINGYSVHGLSISVYYLLPYNSSK